MLRKLDYRSKHGSHLVLQCCRVFNLKYMFYSLHRFDVVLKKKVYYRPTDLGFNKNAVLVAFKRKRVLQIEKQ